MSTAAIVDCGVNATAVSEITRRNATAETGVLITILGETIYSRVGAAAVSDGQTLGERIYYYDCVYPVARSFLTRSAHVT
jgi:hypothetical protein